MKPHKVQLVQELKPHDHPMRFRFAQWIEQRLVEDEHFYWKINFSDEAHFHFDGYVNKQNCRIWESENPHVVMEKPMHPQLFGVVFGPAVSLGHFSSKMSKELSSLSSERYRVMLNEFLLPKFEEEDTNDNRTAHLATQPTLQSIFCALFSKIAWSAEMLMSIGHLAAAIWLRWTIFYGEPSRMRMLR